MGADFAPFFQTCLASLGCHSKTSKFPLILAFSHHLQPFHKPPRFFECLYSTRPLHCERAQRVCVVVWSVTTRSRHAFQWLCGCVWWCCVAIVCSYDEDLPCFHSCAPRCVWPGLLPLQRTCVHKGQGSNKTWRLVWGMLCASLFLRAPSDESLQAMMGPVLVLLCCMVVGALAGVEAPAQLPSGFSLESYDPRAP